jgi:hypothetical protein
MDAKGKKNSSTAKVYPLDQGRETHSRTQQRTPGPAVAPLWPRCGLLGEDAVAGGEGLHRPRRDVAEVADRDGDEIQAGGEVHGIGPVARVCAGPHHYARRAARTTSVASSWMERRRRVTTFGPV